MTPKLFLELAVLYGTYFQIKFVFDYSFNVFIICDIIIMLKKK